MSLVTTSTAKTTPDLRGFFITGNDTDVGKTYASGCIIHTLKQQGIEITPRKPIASGCIKQADGTLLSTDAEFLSQAAGNNESLNTICPMQFEPPISPQTAIQQAGLHISTQDLQQACQFEQGKTYLVEGAGGFYSPLCSDGLNKDLAVELGLPVILVVKNQLGCINHTLLSIAAIEQAGLTLHSIIINYADQGDFTNGLTDWTDAPIYKLNYAKQQTLQTIAGFAI